VGPAVCYGPGAISMKESWVQGAPLILHTQLHTPSEPVAVKDCPLCARSIVTRRRGMGYKIPPWGKGLMLQAFKNTKHLCCVLLKMQSISCCGLLKTQSVHVGRF
jgi:hypothetical protein